MPSSLLFFLLCLSGFSVTETFARLLGARRVHMCVYFLTVPRRSLQITLSPRRPLNLLTAFQTVAVKGLQTSHTESRTEFTVTVDRMFVPH